MLAPYELYFLSFPQPCLLDVPLHLYPAGHIVHAVRVACTWLLVEPLPPDVYLPAPHVKHELADAALYFLSFPQLVQPLVPAGEAYPAPHVVQTPFLEVVAAVSPFPAGQVLTVTVPHPSPLLLAENVDPATQLVHTPFADVVPGVSPRPAGQLVRWFAQLVARAPDAYFPAPQVLHRPTPDAAYFPAVHPVLMYPPVQLYPAVHELHVVRVA